MHVKALSAEQARQIVDVEQVFAAWIAARTDLERRFAGSMFWREIGSGTYLYRKVDSSTRSLGPRSVETEQTFAAFRDGRNRVRDRAETLAARLDEMAPVNRALRLGRLPATSARILRRLQSARLMGHAIQVVGTTALFAYERMAAVQVDSGLLATGDIDLLYDSRRSLKLVVDFEPEGLLGLLRKVDRSFEAARGSFRAINRDGFMVDLIKPLPKDRMASGGRGGIGGADDLQAVEIEGLAWLVSSPKRTAIVVDERGYPAELSVLDPRAFALHKAWMSGRMDRDPLQRGRDMKQARVVARIAIESLGLRFDDENLSALPAALRLAAQGLLPPTGATEPTLEPKW